MRSICAQNRRFVHRTCAYLRLVQTQPPHNPNGVVSHGPRLSAAVRSLASMWGQDSNLRPPGYEFTQPRNRKYLPLRDLRTKPCRLSDNQNPHVAHHAHDAHENTTALWAC